MARENQGLQIALIVCVMLTIILAVTTFLLYRNYDEACTREKAQAKSAEEKDKLAKTTLEENNHLKQLIGIPATDSIQKVDELFKKDMEKCATGLPEEKRAYSNVVQELNSTLLEKQSNLKAKEDDLKKLTDEYENYKKSKNAEVKKFEDSASKATADLAAERAKFQDDITRLRGDHQAVATALEKHKKDAADEKSGLEGELQKREQNVNDMTKKYKDKRKQLDDVLKETVEVPAGQVTQVNQRSRTVYIDLGYADGLRRQVNFSVYAANAIDLTKAGKKGGIEVVQILEDHLSEAQILEDQPGDPIIRGDKIYTPVWGPGETRHFALAGFVDLNGDEVSDQASLCGLIRQNGGVVDCLVDEKGEIQGQMTVDTRFLILGERATEKTGKAQREAFSKLMDTADRLGVPQKPLAKFLEELGWKNHTPVIQYGLGGNPNDFRAKPPAGGNKVSRGSVSEIFKPRTPPKTNGNSAY
jgi:hypothetical protein